MTSALLVSPSFLPGRGGIETFLADICREVAPELGVLAPAERDGRRLPRDLPYPTTPFPGRMLWPGSKARGAIEEALADYGVERVLFGTPFPIALIAPALQKSGVPYASFVHGAELLVPAAVPFLRSRLIGALRGAERLFAVSEFTASHVRRLIGPRAPVHVVYPGVDVDRFHPASARDSDALRKWDLSDSDKVVLHLGRLVPRKGAERLTAIATRLRNLEPRTKVVIAGTGPQLRKLQRRAKHTPGLVVTGRVSEDEARALYARATAFALPVTDRWFGLEVEGLGVVLLEASASGTACVTGRSGGTPEAVLDGATGFVIDGGDPNALANAVGKLLQDEDLAHAMGERGRAHVEERFAGRRRLQPLLDWLQGTPAGGTSLPR